MSIQTRAPSVTTLASGTPAPSVTLMWAETPSSILLASSGYTSTAPPSPVLTFTQSVQLALQWVGVARHTAPKVKLAPLLRPIVAPFCFFYLSVVSNPCFFICSISHSTPWLIIFIYLLIQKGHKQII